MNLFSIKPDGKSSMKLRFKPVFLIALFFSILGFLPGFIVFLVFLMKLNGSRFYSLDSTSILLIATLGAFVFLLLASSWAYLLSTTIVRTSNFVRKQLESQGIFRKS